MVFRLNLSHHWHRMTMHKGTSQNWRRIKRYLVFISIYLCFIYVSFMFLKCTWTLFVSNDLSFWSNLFLCLSVSCPKCSVCNNLKELEECTNTEKTYLSLILRNNIWNDIIADKRDRALSKLSKLFNVPMVCVYKNPFILISILTKRIDNSHLFCCCRCCWIFVRVTGFDGNIQYYSTRHSGNGTAFNSKRSKCTKWP